MFLFSGFQMEFSPACVEPSTDGCLMKADRGHKKRKISRELDNCDMTEIFQEKCILMLELHYYIIADIQLKSVCSAIVCHCSLGFAHSINNLTLGRIHF